MASYNNKLYITISDKRGDGNSIPTPSSSSDNKDKNDKDNLLKRYAEHEMFHLVKGTAIKSVNYAISNIGNFTGDYIRQREVNVSKQMISNVMSIGMSTLAGAKYGPVGAIVGFVAGVSSIAIGSVFEDISNRAEITKNNFDISQLRDRVGLNTIYDGSRGTEN